MLLNIGYKVKKEPIINKAHGTDKIAKIGTVTSMTRYCLTLEYEDKTKESFTLADLISPHSFILKAYNDKEWKQMIAPTKTMKKVFLKG